MAKQAAKSADNTTRWIVVAMVALVVGTGVVFSLFSQNTKESASLAGLDGITPMPAITSTIDPSTAQPKRPSKEVHHKITTALQTDRRCYPCSDHER